MQRCGDFHVVKSESFSEAHHGQVTHPASSPLPGFHDARDIINNNNNILNRGIKETTSAMDTTGRHTDDYRLAGCWRIQNCHACTHSRHGCGWCPHSSTCVPVSSLLQPMSDAKTCPSRGERFELRTKALGCGCSTTTFLSIVVTVFATIAALLLIYGAYPTETFKIT